MSEPVAGGRSTLEFRDYLGILRRRVWTVFLVTAVVTGLGLYWSLQQDKTYSASAEVVLGAANLSTSDVATQAKVLESQAVHDLARKKVAGAVGVNAAEDSSANLITVTAESTSPALAADSVNAHVDAYVEYERQLQLDQYVTQANDAQNRLNGVLQQIAAYGIVPTQATPTGSTGNADLDALLSQRDALQALVRTLRTNSASVASNVNVVARADKPTDPISPKPREDGLIALGAGLLLGLALAFLVEYFDDSIKTTDDLQRATGPDVPVLGLIPRNRASRTKVVLLSEPSSPVAEAYRSLRTSVSFVGLNRGSCFEITSARAQEGKTQTAANLAVATARAGKRVILVDCDLRRPAVHDSFNLPNAKGFTSVVLGEPLRDALQPVPGVENLFVLTSGPLPPNPSEVLGSERCRDVLRALQADGTLVLVDTAPLLPVTDAAVLATAVDGVILVASARRSTRKQLRQAVRILRQIGAPIVGVTLTAAEAGTVGSYYLDVGRRRWRRRQESPELLDPLQQRGSDTRVS